MKVAVIIPCYNEEKTIVEVISGFQKAVPAAEIYVCDNNSSDTTASLSQAAGATVITELNQGKGHAVRRLFADVDADIYVMVDGDATYDPAIANVFIEKIKSGLDFVNGARVSELEKAYRPGHRLGNLVLTGLVRNIFGKHFSDMLSGYKVFSRRYVKSFPALSSGFEIETELTVHALELSMPCTEIETHYGERPEGSVSKLRTFRDGYNILKLIGSLIRNERPLQFFGSIGITLIVVAILLGIPLVITYLEIHMVPRMPTAVLSTSMVIVGFLSIAVGLVLDTVTTARRELKRLFYLSVNRK